MFLESNNLVGPGPEKYSTHRLLTDVRSNSREKRTPSACFGKEVIIERQQKSPGPQNYNITSSKCIGDAASIKVVFSMQERPISARPGKIKKINLGPGPQDYNLVDPNVYKRRSRVIPKISFGFPRAKSAERLDTCKSPGPMAYRPKSAVVLSKSPNACIGKEIRFDKRIMSAQSPGPQTYEILSQAKHTPAATMGSRYKLTQKLIGPGPQAYDVQFSNQLKR